MKLPKHLVRWFIISFVCLLALGGVLWNLGVRYVSLPEELVAEQVPSSSFYDASDALVHVTRGYDYRWNFPVEYSEIPEEMIRYVIAVEDRNFYSHRGFDFLAAIRAARQLLTNGRIVSGASTITMQTMTMFTGRERTLKYKIRQIFLACNWERKHTKEEILELYFNHLPYGGKIYGVEAAALFYFGRHARELNRAEMILLSGIPQGPARFRPDRHPVRAIQRRDVVLHLLVKNGAITAAEADEIRREPLRYRDFSVSCWPHLIDTQYVDLAIKGKDRQSEYRLAMDSELQNGVRAALRTCVAELPQVKDGAAIVIDNVTGYVRACVGTLDFMDETDGKVNAAVAWRSPGSTLKPFIYGEAIYGGLITQESILNDEMLLLDDYRPDNFDGSFRGRVTAAEALADSLNTPAVRLLKLLGVERELELLGRLGILREDKPDLGKRAGLSLAIGGTESRLLNLASAYSRLAGGEGNFRFLTEEIDEEKVEDALWTPGTREMVLEMLRYRPIPGGGGIDVAWKTGTSNGNRDAWCFAVTPKWTVGVWFGNKSGAASPALVGGTAAAPVAASIISLLHKNDPPVWRVTGEVNKIDICKKSGLKPGGACEEKTLGSEISGIPLRRCEECRMNGNAEKPKKSAAVFHPMPGEYLTNAHSESGEAVLKIQLDVNPQKVHLYVDGNYSGMHESGQKVTLSPGHHVLTIWPDENWNSNQISLDVKAAK